MSTERAQVLGSLASVLESCGVSAEVAGRVVQEYAENRVEDCVVVSGGSGSVSSGSWADEVEEAETTTGSVVTEGGGVLVDDASSDVGSRRGFGGSPSSGVETVVQMPEGGPDLRGVRGRIKFGEFGGLGDMFPVPLEHVYPGQGFMRTYVRTERTKAMYAWIRGFGVKMPSTAKVDVALVTYSKAAIPPAFSEGIKRYRAYALLGDRVLKMLLTVDRMNEGLSVGEISNLEQQKQSNVGWLKLAEEKGLMKHVFLGNAPSDSPSVVGNAVEAVIGVVAMWRSMKDVARLAAGLGVVRNPEDFTEASAKDVMDGKVGFRALGQTVHGTTSRVVHGSVPTEPRAMRSGTGKGLGAVSGVQSSVRAVGSDRKGSGDSSEEYRMFQEFLKFRGMQGEFAGMRK